MGVTCARLAPAVVCAAVGGIVLAGCSSEPPDSDAERYAAARTVDSHVYGTKITVTNKQGPQSAEVIEHHNSLSPGFSFVDEEGYVIEWEEMTSQQRSQYQYELKGWRFDLGGTEMMSESRRDVPGEIRDASRR